MFIELKCKNCNKIFNISLDDEEMTISKCPECKTSFNNGHLAHLAEVYYSIKKHSQGDVELLALADGQKDIVFRTDIDSLNNLYNKSSDEIRERMTDLFDLFFLLMYRNAKHTDLKELDNTIKEVRRVYNKKVGHPEDFFIREGD